MEKPLYETVEKTKFLLENTEPPKYSIGFKINNLTVIGIIPGHIYYDYSKFQFSFKYWDKKDPWWKERYVYYVSLDELTPTCSWEQYLEQCPDGDFEHYNENVVKICLLTVREQEIDKRLENSNVN